MALSPDPPRPVRSGSTAPNDVAPDVDNGRYRDPVTPTLQAERDEPGDVGLVVLDATPAVGTVPGLADLVGNAATALAPGGILAVITASDHQGGTLRDLRPALITAARTAGLDYWQHIVTTARPDTADQDRAEGDGRDGDGGDGEVRHDSGAGPSGGRCREWRLVAEVSVFRRPTRGGCAPAAADPAHCVGLGQAERDRPATGPDQATTPEVQR
jgi:hypothetical protein